MDADSKRLDSIVDGGSEDGMELLPVVSKESVELLSIVSKESVELLSIVSKESVDVGSGDGMELLPIVISKESVDIGSEDEVELLSIVSKESVAMDVSSKGKLVLLVTIIMIKLRSIYIKSFSGFLIKGYVSCSIYVY